MSLLTVALLVFGAAYFCWFLFRICKMVWTQGAIGEIVEVDDAAKMVLNDIGKVLTLPFVAWKALRKS